MVATFVSDFVRHHSFLYMRAEGAISLSQSPAGFNTCGACEKDQQWQQALGLLAVMQKSAILPNVISYNAVVSACEIGHQGPQALSLLAVLQRTAGLPNGISFLAAISAFEKGTQWQQVLGLLAVMQQSAVLPNVISFS